MDRDHNNQKNDGCPLCQLTKDAMEILPTKNPPQKNKKSPWKRQLISWGLIMFFGLVAVSMSYKILSNSPLMDSLRQNNPAQKQSMSIFGKITQGNLQINALAPDFLSEDVWGNKIALNNFRNQKSVLLVFWATWCPYCAAELPNLKIFAQKYQDQIQVIAVDSGESRETILNYIKKENINFLILLDEDRKIWNTYLVRGTPSHFLIDKAGKVVNVRPGLASQEDLESMFTIVK